MSIKPNLTVPLLDALQPLGARARMPRGDHRAQPSQTIVAHAWSVKVRKITVIVTCGSALPLNLKLGWKLIIPIMSTQNWAFRFMAFIPFIAFMAFNI